MSSLDLTDEQVIEFVRKLPPDRKQRLLQELVPQPWTALPDGEDRLRAAASERGRDWDQMNDDEKEDFIDDLVHEDRPCLR